MGEAGFGGLVRWSASKKWPWQVFPGVAKRERDGEPCWSLLLEWVVEHGQFGALLNGSTSVSDCNMEVLKNFAFPHRVNDVELVWVPIRVTSDFSDAEGIWQYNHAAEAGRNRLVE